MGYLLAAVLAHLDSQRVFYFLPTNLAAKKTYLIHNPLALSILSICPGKAFIGVFYMLVRRAQQGLTLHDRKVDDRDQCYIRS